MKRIAIVFVCILFASTAFAMGNRSFNANKFGSKDNQRSHNYTVEYQAPPSTPPTVVPTPEPSTLFLVGGGLLGLAALRRRK